MKQTSPKRHQKNILVKDRKSKLGS